MSFPNKISPSTKELMSKSRLIALDLGCDYITTVHFLLADCELDSPASLRSTFPTPQDYNAFYARQRKGEKITLGILDNESLPLTIEAENALRQGLKEMRRYRAKQIEPHHVLLGAAHNKDSLLRKVYEGKNEDLYPALQKIYTSKGILPSQPKRKWWLLILRKP